MEATHYRDTRIQASRFQFTLDSLLNVSNGKLPSLLSSEYETMVASERTPGLNRSFQWTDYSAFYSPQ